MITHPTCWKRVPKLSRTQGGALELIVSELLLTELERAGRPGRSTPPELSACPWWRRDAQRWALNVAEPWHRACSRALMLRSRIEPVACVPEIFPLTEVG